MTNMYLEGISLNVVQHNWRSKAPLTMQRYAQETMSVLFACKPSATEADAASDSVRVAARTWH